MQYIIGVAGLALVFGMAFIVSNDRKKIKYRPILTMLVLQFVLGFLLLNTSAGKNFFIMFTSTFYQIIPSNFSYG